MLPLVTLLAVVPLAACSKKKEESAAKVQVNPEEIKRKAEAARKLLDGLKAPLSDLNTKFAGLRKQFDKLPPDLPDFGDTRGRFYSASVSQGAMSTSVSLFSGRIDSAVKSQNVPELDLVTKDIAHTYEGIRKADSLASELSHAVQPFEQKLAELRQKAEEARANGKLSCETPASVVKAPAKSAVSKK
jgi:predicted  nucleic acid-binding Zn-ribbon protein